MFRINISSSKVCEIFLQLVNSSESHARKQKGLFFQTWCTSSGMHECLLFTMTDYGITYLFHDRRARANMGLRSAR